jgi:glycosyltransferase involved in cell wall biosynthesis
MPDYISFFIPAYNCAKTITESVDSIMEINFVEGDELIIVDDCATDNTGDVLKELQQKYPVIRIINHSRNRGGAAARNTAVESAKNDLLFCLDSDNVLPANSIAPLKKYLIEMNADVATFQFQHFFLTDKLKQEYIWSLPEGVLNLQNILNGENTPGQHGNYLFTKSSWINAKGYAEGTGALDTWTFGLRQAITGAQMVVLKDTFYYHRLDYANSYWMKDAQAKIWSVSVKVTQALFPFFEILDEKFINYILGDGKYLWYYNLKKRPIVLVPQGSKDQFYKVLHEKVNTFVYPKPSILKRAVNKIKRELKIK